MCRSLALRRSVCPRGDRTQAFDWTRFAFQSLFFLFLSFRFLILPAAADEAKVMSVSEAVRDYNNDTIPNRLAKTVTLAGVLTSDPVVVGKEASLTNLQDDTGGLVLFSPDTSLLVGKFKRGDLVQVRGRVKQYKGMEELVVEGIHRLGTREVPPPRDVLAAELQAGHYKGQLVRLAGKLTVPPDLLDKSVSAVLRDRSGEIAVYATPRLFNNPTFADRLMKGGDVEIVGVAGQYKDRPPFNSGYRLVPRDPDDFKFAPIPPYRMIAFLLAILVLAAATFYFWARRRNAERRAREMARLSESLKQSERALRESESRLRAIIETEPECVKITRCDGTLLEMNPAGLSMIECESPAAVLGKPVYPLISPEHRPAFQALTESVCQGNKGTLEYELVGLKGARRWMETHAVPFHSEDGCLSMLSVTRDITKRKQAEEALREAEKKYRAIFENAVEGIFQTTPEGRYLSLNPALARIYGYESPEEMTTGVTDIGRQVYVDPDRRAEFKRLVEERGFVERFEYQVYRKDGKKIWLSENARAVRDAGGAVLYYEGFVVDMSERRALEDQLRHAQKMEAVGRLAGGIAHDFNNLLMVIRGHAELLREGAGPGDPRQRNVEQIQKAAERAASLTQQLLAYSRKQVIAPKVLDLNTIVAEMGKMLPRLIGEDVELVVAPKASLGRVRVDRGQIEQVLLNLAVNARDAMPQGGKLTIETANVELDENYASQHTGVQPGPYVLLAVSDTGMGMDAETMSHIFEPFFTTKEFGKGTGLGLATVFGIVKQSDGHIWVYSEPGHGTTFKTYLPQVEGAPEEAGVEKARPESLQGVEAVLLVEDDEAVRELVCDSLRRNGYTVLEAKDGAEALQVSERHQGPIHMMVTDVVMPGMSGRELAHRLAPRHPGMKVLYVSGYTESAVIHHGVLDPGTAFLQKPFRPDDLAHKVREMLDGCKPQVTDANRIRDRLESVTSRPN